jgi:NADH dehydrogenase
MHRGYHGMAVPTWNRKIRVFADWTLGMFLKREVVSLGAIENPREEFYEAARPPRTQQAAVAAPAAAAGPANAAGSAGSADKTAEKATAS